MIIILFAFGVVLFVWLWCWMHLSFGASVGAIITGALFTPTIAREIGALLGLESGPELYVVSLLGCWVMWKWGMPWVDWMWRTAVSRAQLVRGAKQTWRYEVEVMR